MTGPRHARRRLSLLAAVPCLLAGCATRMPMPVTPAPLPVQAPAAMAAPKPVAAPHVENRRCPSAGDIARLRETRPHPQRERKMPATTSERVARIAAQLGLYEAQGQWADQVERAFRKCDDR